MGLCRLWLFSNGPKGVSELSAFTRGKHPIVAAVLSVFGSSSRTRRNGWDVMRESPEQPIWGAGLSSSIANAIHTYIDEHRKCHKPTTNIDQPMPVQPRAPRHATFQRAADGRADSDFLCRLRATREADIAKRGLIRLAYSGASKSGKKNGIPAPRAATCHMRVAWTVRNAILAFRMDLTTI